MTTTGRPDVRRPAATPRSSSATSTAAPATPAALAAPAGSPAGSSWPALELDPALVEEAVLLAVRDRPGDEQALHAERDRLYEVDDAEGRDRAFNALHLRWLERLGLGGVVARALAEVPAVLSTVSACIVAMARRRRDEGVELFVDSGTGDAAEGDGSIAGATTTLRILLRPRSLLEPDHLLWLLRHELLHVADIIDARFSYSPTIPALDGGQTATRLVMDRYTVLWNLTIDGRLERRGAGAAGVRQRRFGELRRAFPMLAADCGRVFDHFYDRDGHTHDELVAFALDPRGRLPGVGRDDATRSDGDVPSISSSDDVRSDPRSSAPGAPPALAALPAVPIEKITEAGLRSRSGCCPLCSLPTYAFFSGKQALPDAAIEMIRHDFPEWRPADGLCPQCADLYRCRSATSTTG